MLCRLALPVAVALAATATPAQATHDHFARISAGEVNGNGDSIAAFRTISADGSRVLFVTAEQLVANDTDTFEDIYQRSGGKTTLISTAPGAGNGPSSAFYDDYSDDGSRVVFSTFERLSPSDTDDAADLYQRDGTTTRLISAGQVNGNGAFNAAFKAASSDGSRIIFQTDEQLVPEDTDSEFDLYERFGDTTTLVSAGQVNGNGSFAAIFRAASADASTVFFETREQLVPADTDNAIDAYKRSGGVTSLVSAGTVNGNGNFDVFLRSASANGSRAFFETSEQLVPGDTDGAKDVYMRSSGTATLISGGSAPIDAFYAGASADGSKVFFQTDEQLTGNDTDAQPDIYESSGGAPTLITAPGNGNFGAFFADASDDGSRVLFITNESLVGTDTDGSPDLYERSGGTTSLVSTGDINGNGSFFIVFGGASKDGSKVFFMTSEQLVADDRDLSQDVYERAGGRTTLVSPGGFSAASDATFAATSDDGSRAFFTTSEPVLQNDLDTTFDTYGAYTSPGDGPPGQPHDLFTRVSTGQINGNGPFGASLVGSSDDGSRAYFVTPEQLAGADADNSTDLYERAAGGTTLLSTGPVGGNGAFTANFSGSSSDGKQVFFNTSEQLVTDDTDSSIDIYQHSAPANTTKRVSVGTINGNGAFPAAFERASVDGSRVLFTTDEKLAGGDTDATTDIYDRSGGSTKQISSGNQPIPVRFEDASDDGSRVFYTTDEPIAGGDTDASRDAYMRTGASTVLVSAGEINGNKSDNVFFGGASADGQRAFFETEEQLVPNDTDNDTDVYERSGPLLETIKRVSAGQVNGNGALAAHFRGASADGSQVFFETREQLVATDTDSSQDVYRRSGGTTFLVSAGQINGNLGNDANFRAASDDGSRVYFETRERLVTADTDGVSDVYERADGTTRLISAGEDGSAVGGVLGRVSADGLRVFFQTTAQAAAEDTDANNDIYERAAGRTRLVTPGPAFVALTRISKDGSSVFFNTTGPFIASDVDGTSDDYAARLSP